MKIQNEADQNIENNFIKSETYHKHMLNPHKVKMAHAPIFISVVILKIVYIKFCQLLD